MGDRNIKKETKKPKKSDKKASAGLASGGIRETVTQPTLIKKEKKIK